MSGEDFVRCPDCGNLNIKGSPTCLFCDAELPVSEEDVGKEIETFKCPSCTTDLPIHVTACPICGWAKPKGDEEVTPSDRGEAIGVPQVGDKTPEIPDLPSIPETTDKRMEIFDTPELPDILTEDEPVHEIKPETKLKESTESPIKDRTITAKFIFVFFTSTLLISLIHYGINLAIAFASISITDPNLELLPLASNLGDKIHINALSFYLALPVTIFAGYFGSKIICKYVKDSRKSIPWIGIYIILDICIHIAIPLVLTIIFEPREILFSKLAGASLIFLVSNIATIFIFFVAGGYWLYKRIDNVYFPKKHSSS